jgi:acyl-CoA synthetase
MVVMTRRFPIVPVADALRRRYRVEGHVTDQPVNRLLALAAARHPQRDALVDVTTGDEVRLTYAELYDAACRIAAWLRSQGVGAGDVVTTQTPNLWDHVAVCWAAWHVGAVLNPVVDIYRERELHNILSGAAPAAVVAIAEHRGFRHAEAFDAVLDDLGQRPRARLVLRGAARGWTSYEDAHRADPAPGAPVDLDPDQPVLVLYTSGTTSAPKGVLHSSRTLVADARQLTDAWSFGWDDRIYLPVPIGHVTGVEFALLFPAYRAGSVLLSRVDLADPGRGWREIARYDVTTAGVADLPALLDAFAAVGKAPTIRTCLGGLQRIPPDVVERAAAHGILPMRIYGMTECPSVTAPSACDPEAVRLGTDGPIAPGVECQAVDPDTRRPLPDGDQGELRVRGPERMLGYVDPEQTAAAIDADGWYYTGDLGKVEDGFVTITGRIKETISRGGEKFAAREIEDVLLEHPAVAQVAVVPAPDPGFGEVPAAFVVLRPDATAPADDELRAHVREQGLAKQKAPVHWRLVDALPMTGSGKVKKFELEAQLSEELSNTEAAGR